MNLTRLSIEQLGKLQHNPKERPKRVLLEIKAVHGYPNYAVLTVMQDSIFNCTTNKKHGPVLLSQPSGDCWFLDDLSNTNIVDAWLVDY